MSPRKSEFDAIEALVCRDLGRGTQALIDATRGELADAARSLAAATSVGLITGFFVPRGDVAAAETDGPVGTALLAASLAACGVPARIAVDSPCADAVRAAVGSAGHDVTVDEMGVVDRPGLDRVIGDWKQAGVSHAVAIERCGIAADGRPRNMRGVDVSPWTAPLDDLFLGGPWRKVGVGDGGNEIGMGKLPAGLIAKHVPNGAKIACVTSCDHLVVAGVSNWGAYGLMAALTLVRPEWSADDREVPDRGTRPRRHAGSRRRSRCRRWRHGATRGNRRRLRPRRARRADRWAASHCLGESGGLGCAAMENPYRANASRDPRRHPPALPEVRRRLLARARPRARLPDGVRQGADRGRLALDPDSRGIRRRGPRHLGGGCACWRKSSARAATALPATPRCTSWARCCGTAAPSRRSATCPSIASGELRLQAFGVTEPSSGTDTLALRTTAVKKNNSTYVVNGQKVWTSRAEHSDLMLLLARTTPREQTQEAHRGPVGLPGRHAPGAGQGPHHPADPHHDEPQHAPRCSSTTWRCRPRT